jgi:hypothetical protein
MSEAARDSLEAARREVLEKTPCVWCGRPAGEHDYVELREHLDKDKERRGW